MKCKKCVNIIKDPSTGISYCAKCYNVVEEAEIELAKSAVAAGARFIVSPGFNPEVVTLAKGIAGGVPMGACLFRGKAADVFVAGDHQSTFAGNPLACSAAEIVLAVVNNEDFLHEVINKGDYIRSIIKSWDIPIVKDVRGKGLMIGTQIDTKVKPFDIEVKCLEKGLCTTTAGADVVRFLPPLTISDKEIDEGLAIFKSVLEEFSK